MVYSSIQLRVFSRFHVSTLLMQIVPDENRPVSKKFTLKDLDTYDFFNYNQYFIAEPAQATDDCPHQFGYYGMGDARSCGQFKNCVDGRAFIFDCPEGLAFNADTYRCDWPDQVASCDAEGTYFKYSSEFVLICFLLSSLSRFQLSSRG